MKEKWEREREREIKIIYKINKKEIERKIQVNKRKKQEFLKKW